jgi:hypothetical protein
MSTTIQGRPARQVPRTRVAALVAGAVLALFSLGFFAAGGLLLWGDSQKDADGYLTTDTERFSTDTVALSTENLDFDLGDAGSVLGDGGLGTLRLRAESQDGKSLFVGIARTSDVERYLGGTAHDVLEDIDTDPFNASYSHRDGAATVAAPTKQHFWADSAQGDGVRTLEWKVDDGDWSVVVMNADGSPGVKADVNAGASLGFRDDAGKLAITTGVVLVFGAIVLLISGRPRRPSSALGTTDHAVVAAA